MFDKDKPSCGTVTENRKGFPVSMKNGKTWVQKQDRRSVSGIGTDPVLHSSARITSLLSCYPPLT